MHLATREAGGETTLTLETNGQSRPPPTPRSGPWASVSLRGSLPGVVEVEKRILTMKLRRAFKGGTPKGRDHLARPGGGLASLTANESGGRPGPSPPCSWCSWLTDHSDLNSHQSRKLDSAGLVTWLTPEETRENQGPLLPGRQALAPSPDHRGPGLLEKPHLTRPGAQRPPGASGAASPDPALVGWRGARGHQLQACALAPGWPPDTSHPRRSLEAHTPVQSQACTGTGAQSAQRDRSLH